MPDLLTHTSLTKAIQITHQKRKLYKVRGKTDN